jgi:heme exporter protein C
MRRLILPIVAGVAAIIGLVLAMTTPPDAFQGDFARIFHVHVPSSWIAFLAFFLTALGSVMWMITRRGSWDRLAAASAEVGVLFTAAALLTGSLWGKPVWGRFWDWGDARLASTALMFFVYLGYLALRRATIDPVARARRSSILGMMAVIQVPLVYFSVNLWRSLHQTQTIRPDGAAMGPEMLRAFLVNLLAFNLVYIALLVGRIRLSRVQEEAVTSSVAAGAAITAPRLDPT